MSPRGARVRSYSRQNDEEGSKSMHISLSSVGHCLHNVLSGEMMGYSFEEINSEELDNRGKRERIYYGIQGKSND